MEWQDCFITCNYFRGMIKFIFPTYFVPYLLHSFVSPRCYSAPTDWWSAASCFGVLWLLQTIIRLRSDGTSVDAPNCCWCKGVEPFPVPIVSPSRLVWDISPACRLSATGVTTVLDKEGVNHMSEVITVILPNLTNINCFKDHREGFPLPLSLLYH